MEMIFVSHCDTGVGAEPPDGVRRRQLRPERGAERDGHRDRQPWGQDRYPGRSRPREQNRLRQPQDHQPLT